MTEMEKFIRDYARSIGIDPEQAMRVVLSEGGRQSLTDTTRQALGTEVYGREESYGPLQAHIRGGLGSEMLKSGIDVRKPEDAYRAVKWQLDYAKQHGWGSWHGWKGDPFAGISKGTTLSSVPENVAYPSSPVVGGQTPVGSTPQDLVTPSQAVLDQKPKSWFEGFKERLMGTDTGKEGEKEGGGGAIADLASAISGETQKGASPGDLPQADAGGEGDSGRYQAAQALMNAILAGQRGSTMGISLNSSPFGTAGGYQWPPQQGIQ